ncbi:UNVERIFIED_CONTAM: hypothetical protein Sangu_2493200 [Sesamum angustifolium]|uniref:Uncharacterized protein n=1 Tax=Sesamum angustifolium TaxID=2727405 RepID=A0AAW2KH71_9LAMI
MAGCRRGQEQRPCIRSWFRGPLLLSDIRITIPTTTFEPGYGEPHWPPRGDDGQHDGYDARDAGQLLYYWTVTADRL